MAENVKPKVRVPKTAAAGEAITLKTLISHPMESGQRKDGDGNLRRFVANVGARLIAGQGNATTGLVGVVGTDGQAAGKCLVGVGLKTHFDHRGLTRIDVDFRLIDRKG